MYLNKDLGFLRIGAAVPHLKIADVDFNISAITELLKKARSEGVQVLIFPEMSLTGYTIGDLVHQHALLAKAEEGLAKLVEISAAYSMIVIVGLPLSIDQKVFNCAAVINAGRLLGIIPKTYIPSYKEFYEGRWFVSGDNICSDMAHINGAAVPFGSNILFSIQSLPSAMIGIEICEDLWVPLAPHEYQALAGANILVNISTSNDILAKTDWRRTMLSSESGRCSAAFCYVSAGINESSNDVVFGGHAVIAEDATILEESQDLVSDTKLMVADIDIDKLVHDRQSLTSFRQNTQNLKAFRIIEVFAADIVAAKLFRVIDPQPFVPKDPSRRAERCHDIFAMQVAGLAQKLTGSGIQHLVLGVSGGLDSTLALLAAVKTMDFLKLPRSNIYAFTMPGFGTTSRTKNNATSLCEALGVNIQRVDITRTCKAHLADLGHLGHEDLVFENVQARYRTEFLFNKANELNGILLGTGDLTEVALGWCTFSGDHMSHYHVNISVPKTLVRYLIRWVADEEMSRTSAHKILYDVLDTPISPELKRPARGKITQMSEDIIGPVELADFFLYPFIRLGARPGKILFMANEARKRKLFEGRYSMDELHSWLENFIKRFFANQFKRTCLPEGPKVGSVSLSPRGDWRMPSDARPALWLEDIERVYTKLRG
ncbi:MAG: NAD(+) synthase [Dehalococcoidia bacterium]|nr:NAD(+) synthase [Dehalococcoidia bacterium]